MDLKKNSEVRKNKLHCLLNTVKILYFIDFNTLVW